MPWRESCFLGGFILFMTRATCWLFLMTAIALGILGLSLLKELDQTWPWVGLVSMYVLCIVAYYLRAKAITQIPVVVAYAVWEAVGLVLVILVGIFWFKEDFGPVRFAGAGLLVAGSYLVHRGTESGDGDDRLAGGGK